MNLSIVVLLGLAVVWAIVLAPEVLRRTSGMRRVDPVHAFHRQMSSLDRPGSRGVGRPGTNVIDLRGPARTSARPMQRPTAARYGGAPARPVRAARPAHRPAPRAIVSPRTQKRRQDVLIVLVAAAVLTLLCAVAFGGAFLLLHLVADVLLVAYVVLLNRSAQMAARPRRAGYGYQGYGQQIDLRSPRPQRPQPVAVPGTRRVAN